MKRDIRPEDFPDVIEPAAILAQQQGAPAEPASAQGGIFSRVLSNAGSNVARQASAFLVVLVLPPLLVRSLDKPTYAIWLLILQITSYITLIDNGIQTVVARYVALERATTGAAGVARVLSNATVLLGIVAAFTLGIFIAATPALSWLLPDQPEALLAHARGALMITAATTALALPFSGLAGMFTGDQRSGVNALAATVGKVAGAAAVAWVASRHGGLESMALALAAGTVLQSLLYVVATRFHGTVTLFSWRLVERRYLGEIFLFSSGMMASQLAGLLIAGLDLPMVSAFDFPQAAYYGLALTASNLLQVPFAAFVAAFMPVVTAIHAEGDARRLGHVLEGMTRYANVLVGLLMVALGTSLPALLHWWVRPEYATHVLPLAEVLLAMQTVRLTFGPYSIVGFSAGKQKQMLYSPVGEGVINLVCSFFGAKLFGAMGVAVGSLVGAFAGVILHLLVSIPLTQGVIRLKRGDFVLRSILRPLAAVSVAVPVFLLGNRWVTTPVQGLSLSAICVLTSLPAAWLWGLDARDRARVLRHFANRA